MNGFVGLFSSVGRALDSKSKGHRFNSGKGHSARMTYDFTPPAMIAYVFQTNTMSRRGSDTSPDPQRVDRISNKPSSNTVPWEISTLGLNTLAIWKLWDSIIKSVCKKYANILYQYGQIQNTIKCSHQQIDLQHQTNSSPKE